MSTIKHPQEKKLAALKMPEAVKNQEFLENPKAE
jgi:hypothetical protein